MCVLWYGRKTLQWSWFLAHFIINWIPENLLLVLGNGGVVADAATINGSASARLFGDITDVPACVHGEALTDIVPLNVFGIDSWGCPVTIWSISNIFLSRAVHICDTGPPLHLLFRALPWWALWCEHNLLFITLGQLWPTVVVCIRLRKKALWPHLKPHLQPPWVVLQCLPTSFAKDAASSAWCQSYQRYASKCLPDTISWGYLGLHPTHAYLNEKSELVRWFDYSRQ